MSELGRQRTRTETARRPKDDEETTQRGGSERGEDDDEGRTTTQKMTENRYTKAGTTAVGETEQRTLNSENANNKNEGTLRDDNRGANLSWAVHTKGRLGRLGAQRRRRRRRHHGSESDGDDDEDDDK